MKYLFIILFSCHLVWAQTKAPTLIQDSARDQPIRQQRPTSIALNILGSTPWAGVLLEGCAFNHFAAGVGWGYLKVQDISASFVPISLKGYLLKSGFSPYLTLGLDLITLSIQANYGFLNSTFQGTQLFIGSGLEQRFDFGLLLRVEIIRYIQAKAWVPALTAGYSLSLY